MIRFLTYLATTVVLAFPGLAQVVETCESSPLPWIMPGLSQDAYHDFANGAVRVFDVYVDSNLPSGVLIGVLHPRPSDLSGAAPYQACSAIYSQRDEVGYFGQVFLARTEASYNPATGLSLRIPVRYDYIDRPSEEGELTLVINQSTGTVDALERRAR